MCRRLTNFLNLHKILNPHQYGFTKGKTTEDAIIESVSQILKNYEKCQTTIATFFDLTKAFDCINIEILLDKLDWYGIRGTALDWWRSFLTQRTQYVELQSNIKNNIIFQKSDIKPLKYGIPQVSVAGPLLYIIYVNSILQSNTLKLNTKLVKYADDTSCLVSCKTL